ncbi:MAG TPA: cupin domain-containing protein [Urbifossiella sp.]|nr:cupin domain-containing protein [Urbifossiella sp.]
MRHEHLQFGRGFRIFIDHAHAEAAPLTLAPGETGGGPGGGHTDRDQWLYVCAGAGVAVVGGEHIDLRTGMLVRIGEGETHEVRNTGTELLKTLTVYVPLEPRRPERNGRADPTH